MARTVSGRPVTVVVAAWNEEEAIEATLERLAATSYPGRVAVVLADNNSTDRTAELAEARQRGSASTIGGCSSRSQASSTPSTGCSRRSRRRSW